LGLEISRLTTLLITSISLFKPFYRAFHRFGQAKFPDGGSVLGLSQFSILPPAASKNDAWFKSDQN